MAEDSSVEKLVKKLQKIQGEVAVGWFEGAAYDDNVTVAQVAFWQELGTKSAPARPFLRPASEKNKDKWSNIFKQSAKSYIDSSSDNFNGFDRLGLSAVADIKNEIVEGDHEPLTPLTIALRKRKNLNLPIGGKIIGEVAEAIAEGKTGEGELGDINYSNQDPLRDTGYMLSTLTYEVKD